MTKRDGSSVDQPEPLGEPSMRKSLADFSVAPVADPAVSLPPPVNDTSSERWELVQTPRHALEGQQSERNLPHKEVLAHEVAYNLEGLDEIELLSETGVKQVFHVRKVQGDHISNGLNAYILHPKVLSGQQSGPVEVKLLFRGTKDKGSVVRDLDPAGAGATTLREGAETIHQHLDEVLNTVHEQFPGRGAALTIAGHSLGGADVQNYAGYLLNRIADQRTQDDDEFEMVNDCKSFRDIVKVELFTKTSAGVPGEANERVRQGLARLREGNDQIKKDDVQVDICHMKVHGDLVQSTGDCFIGSDIQQDEANVELLKVYTRQDASRMTRHTAKFFNEKSKNTAQVYGYDSHSNNSDAGKKEIRRSLHNTSPLLRARAVKTLQSCAYSLLKCYSSALSGW